MLRLGCETAVNSMVWHLGCKMRRETRGSEIGKLGNGLLPYTVNLNEIRVCREVLQGCKIFCSTSGIVLDRLL